ncbi:MAG: signal recognition particle subunit SRP19/SEC65 family protein [Methanobacteriaceae archaeon]|nr:signal recognition particle subunit SRP19/SEC65 family protein [Methanobacteriaceae archaeon]
MKEVMIWPIYLDSNKSLNEGRKVSKEFAVPDVKIKDIVKAADKLRYKYTLESDKSYPGEWYNKSGRIIIESDESKKDILIALSEKIKEQRAIKENQRKNNNNKRNRKRK